MTYGPPTLVDLGKYWVANGGTNLGIVGDTAHALKGVSYHLGRGQLLPDAYSIQTARDKAGLTEAASAIDLGKLNGSYPRLRAFSDWLARRCVKNVAGTGDIREVIYSPDGKTVLGFKDGIDYLIPGYGDDSHLFHTHISYFRDSEKRDKRPVFAPYFTLPDSSTEEPVRTFKGVNAARTGVIKISGDDHWYLDLATNKLAKIGTAAAFNGTTGRRAYGPVTLVGTGPTIGLSGYVFGDAAAYVQAQDVATWTPDSADTKHTVTLSVDGSKKYEVAI